MRFGVGAGPLYVGTSTRRNRKGSGGWVVLTILVVFAWIGLKTYPGPVLAVALGICIFVVLNGLRVKRRRLARIAQLNAETEARSAAAAAIPQAPAIDPDSKASRLVALSNSYGSGMFTEAEYIKAYSRIMGEPDKPSDPPATVQQ